MNYFGKVFFLAASIFTALSLNGCADDTSEGSSTSIVFANLVPLWWNAQPLLIDFSGIEGVDVRELETQTGAEAKNSVLNGTADIGIVAASPLVLSALNNERGFTILGRYMDGPELVGILSVDDANFGLSEPIAIVSGTVSEFVLHAHAARVGVEISPESTLLSVRPPSVESTLRNGDAKSAVIWEPFAQQILDSPDINIAYADYPRDLYSMKFFLIANNESLERKPEAIASIVDAFNEMSQEIVNDTQVHQGEIEILLGYSSGYLDGRFDKVDFQFTDDPSILQSDLVAEANIMVRAGALTRIPEFGHFFTRD